MPGNAAKYGDSVAARFRRCGRRLTLWQYALFLAVTGFITCFGTIALLATVAFPSTPHHWPLDVVLAAALTLPMTAFYTWHRRSELRQDRDRERHEDDRGDDEGTAAPRA